MAPRRDYGDGTIRERSPGHWEARLYLPPGPDGKRQRIGISGKSRREVANKLAQARARKEAGELVGSTRETIASYLTRWLEETIAPTRSPKTLDSYGQMVRCHIIPAVGRHRISALKPEHVEQMMATMRAGGSSERTIAYARSILRAALNRLVKRRALAVNVVTLSDAPTVPEYDAASLSPAQARRFLAAIAGDRLEALYILAICTGLRRSELLGLKWGDIDLASGILHVRRQLYRVPRQGWVERTPKSRAGRADVALIPLAADALERHRIAQRAEMASALDWSHLGLAFANRNGRPIEGGNLLRRSFHPLLERAGLPPMHLHELRHSLATLLLEAGVDTRIVQDVLRHSQATLTMQTYQHVRTDVQRDALARVGRLLTGLNGRNIDADGASDG